MNTIIFKRIVSYLLLTTLIGIGIYFSHSLLTQDQPGELTVIGVYAYFYFFAIIIYLLMEGVYMFLPNSTGLIFLASVFVKMGFFTLIYKATIFSDQPLILGDKIAIIIPFIVFLLLEVLGLVRLLNSADQQAE